MQIRIKKGIREKFEKGFEDIVFFHTDILERDLHNGQARCLKGMKLKDTFIHCGNRYGKGDIGLGYLAWLAFYKPVGKFKNRHIDLLNTSISQDQANIIFNKFEQNLLDKKYFSWMIKDVKKSPFPHIDFKNDTTLWFRNASQNGKYLEGHSYFHINFDESDLQENYLYFIENILAPRVWDFGGNISHMTTPRRGKKNAFKVMDNMKKEVQRGKPDVFVFNGDSRENKFLHPKAIDKMNNLSTRLLNKNVLGLFEDSDGIISNEHLDYAESIAIGLMDKPRPGYSYTSAWDLARSSTYCCGATIEIDPDPTKPLQLVSFERFQDAENKDREYWKKVERRIKERDQKWFGKSVIDKTGVGDVVFSYIEEIDPIGIQLAQENGRLREDIINEGITTIEMGMIGIPGGIEQVIDNELWTLRDELTDFDPENLKYVIWDMVCAIFLAIWVARGHRFSNKEKPKKIPSVCGVRGVNKHGRS